MRRHSSNFITKFVTLREIAGKSKFDTTLSKSQNSQTSRDVDEEQERDGMEEPGFIRTRH